MSVLVLMTECTSLTVTLVLTIRKFISLVFSIYYFNNPFTLYHWSATFMVFAGSLLFMDLPVVNEFFNYFLKKLTHVIKYEPLVNKEKELTIEPSLYDIEKVRNK